jgi:putative FmdB family regulatory protein
MPTYDYKCGDCEDEREYQGIASDNQPNCAACGSNNVKRLPSGFNFGSGVKARPASNDEVLDHTGKGPVVGTSIEMGTLTHKKTREEVPYIHLSKIRGDPTNSMN